MNSPVNLRAENVLGLKRTLSVMLTYQCNAECANCGTLSHPRAKGTLDREVLMSAIAAAGTLDFGNVVFTGGEATLRPVLLLEGLQAGRAHGLSTRLVTNAYWARTPERATTAVARLVDAGLQEINFSTGEEHIRFVELDRVGRAAAAALRAGLTTCIMVELRTGRQFDADDVRSLPDLREAEAETGRRAMVIESPWMPLDPFEPGMNADTRVTDQANVAARNGCDSVLQTYTLMPDGNIKACCGIGARLIPELTVGDLAEDDFLPSSIAAAERDFLKYWLRFEGPEKILAWCAEHDPTIDWEGLYAHRCQACLRIYKDERVQRVICEHYHEILSNVMLGAWMDTVAIPNSLNQGSQLPQQNVPIGMPNAREDQI